MLYINRNNKVIIRIKFFKKILKYGHIKLKAYKSGDVHLVRSQNFPKNYHFLPSDTQM